MHTWSHQIEPGPLLNINLAAKLMQLPATLYSARFPVPTTPQNT